MEDPEARAIRGLPLTRRPRHAVARHDVVVVPHVRLHFVSHAGRHRQGLAQTDVVLHVQPDPRVRVPDVRIADTLREAARPTGGKGLGALEIVRAQIVRLRVRGIARAGELEAGAKGVPAAHVVQVRVEAELRVRRAAAPLGAAAIQILGHDERELLHGARGPRVCCVHVKAVVEHHASADRSRVPRLDVPLVRVG